MRLIAFSFLLTLAACSQTQTVFVNAREVPLSPKFMVLPSGNSASEIDYANKVESAVLDLGVSVVNRPSTNLLALSPERSNVYDEVQADILILAYGTSERVRIMKKDTKEILASFEMSTRYADKEAIRKMRVTLSGLMQALNISTKTLYQ